MSNDIRPSSVAGIKSLARDLKVELGIKHSSALDVASQRAGYQNFRHARNILECAAPSTPIGHRVFITVYWRDTDTNQRGRETLSIILESEWIELVEPAKLPKLRRLEGFYGVAHDHIECRRTSPSQSHARRLACEASRILQFMDATKLRHSTASQRALPGIDSARDSLPGRDHYGVWYDRASKRYLLVDEPYEAAARHEAKARADWAARHRFNIARPAWPGMYNPDGNSQIYLVSHKDKGIPLEPIVTALNRLPAPLVEDKWEGESGPYMPFFSTPHGRPIEKKRTSIPSKPRLRKAANKRMHPARKLLIEAINYLLSQNLISLSGKDENRSHCMATIAGKQAVIAWHGISGGELAVSVWWDYDHSKHPQANLQGNSREQFATSRPLAKRQHYPKFVGALASGWLERETSRHLQGKGKRGMHDLYFRPDAKLALAEWINPVGNGFAEEGQFFS